jgi:phenylalanyl-tRNA synthetase beta chain
MKVSYAWLKKYFDAPIPPAETLADLFTFHSFEVEGIEKFEHDGTTDTVIDVKVLPDRAHYCNSHKGVAGEVSLLTKVPYKNYYCDEYPSSLPRVPVIEIKEPSFCRRYVGRYLELPKVEHSFRWMETQLASIGQRAINAVVDSTNEVMFDIGQPLHAFDADKVKGNIVVRKASEGEKIVLLDGREVVLNTNDHVIADDEGPLAIAGVKGGKRAEVTTDTKKIILESANFNPTAVRITSTRLNLRNESSKRYENEITPELAIAGMNNICALIKSIMPEAEFGPIMDVYPVKPLQTIIEIDPSYVSDRLGIVIPPKECKEILEQMGIVVVEQSEKQWKLTIPYERLDLTIAEDIVEEIGRIYGYEKIKGILPPITSKVPSVLPAFYLAEKIKNILITAGFSEVNLYTLVAKGEIETAYPLARDKSFARKNLIDGMMVALEKNALHAELLGLDTIKVFEIGRSFSKEKERTILAIGVAQVKKIKGVTADQIAKNACDLLQKELDVDISAPNSLSKGVQTVIEIDLDELARSYKPGLSYTDLGFGRASENRFEKYSQYPFIVRDIAVFVPDGVASEEVWSLVEEGLRTALASRLLARHALFDSFKKDGKMSYAFRMVFQSMDKTLTDDEANMIMQKIYALVAARNWQVR